MTRATWDVIDRGAVPLTGTNDIEFDCPGCGREALLPVLGLALAQTAAGVVFDVGEHAMPREIRCRHCRRHFELT